MKLKLILVLLLCLVATALSAAPRLIIEESSFDFGYVPQKARISHVFWLKSAGDDSLKILKVTPGCGCTKAPLENSEIAVGDSTRLEIIFSTKTYKNKISKSPRIQTNEGPPEKRVTFQTFVVADTMTTYPLVLKPFKIDFTSQTGKPTELQFNITNLSDKDLNLKLVDYPVRFLSIDLPDKIHKNSSSSGTVKLVNNDLSDKFFKSFTIEVDDEENSRFTIPVSKSTKAMTNK
ncbi:DUF1573 domain-containing protein [Candidatus Zixiibacteriota bacterium]